MNRHERRRQQRASEKRPVIIAGDGIVAAALGHHYEARPHAELPPKEPGRHRWIAAGSWVISQDVAASAFDADQLKFLDNENLMHLSIGCWDCEQPLGVIAHDSRCPAPGDD